MNDLAGLHVDQQFRGDLAVDDEGPVVHGLVALAVAGDVPDDLPLTHVEQSTALMWACLAISRPTRSGGAAYCVQPSSASRSAEEVNASPLPPADSQEQENLGTRSAQASATP